MITQADVELLGTVADDATSIRDLPETTVDLLFGASVGDGGEG